MNVPAPKRLSRYLAVILRWLVIVFVVFIVTLFTGGTITNYWLPKVYTATAQIQVRPRALDIGPENIDLPTPQSDFEIMQSADVLLPIIHDLNLEKIWAEHVFKSKEDLSDEDAVAYMNKIVRLDAARGTNVINITVSSDVPLEAAQIANAVADRYKTMRDQQQDNAQRGSSESPVRIISRAEAPKFPAKPNKHMAYIVTVLVATFLSIAAASFVEIILLFLRAGERTEN